MIKHSIWLQLFKKCCFMDPTPTPNTWSQLHSWLDKGLTVSGSRKVQETIPNTQFHVRWLEKICFMNFELRFLVKISPERKRKESVFVTEDNDINGFWLCNKEVLLLLFFFLEWNSTDSPKLIQYLHKTYILQTPLHLLVSSVGSWWVSQTNVTKCWVEPWPQE